jgi:hypothetical protein
LKKVRIEDEFTLRYTDPAQAQLEALSFDVLSKVERELERICREEDPMGLGWAEEAMPSRRRYEIGPVHVVAWVTLIEPDMRLLTVVEVVFPDEPVPDETPSQTPLPPQPEHPPTPPEQEPAEGTGLRRKPRRILYPLRQTKLPAEV